MNDLLGGSSEAKYRADDGDIEAGDPALPTPPVGTDGDQAMKAFFKTVEEIKENMAEIRGLQREVVDLNEKGKTLVKTKDVHKHQEEMQVGACL